MQEFLDARLRQNSQTQYAVEFYSQWSALRNSGFEADRQAALIPSHYFWADTVKIHLHWLLTQEVDSYYEYYGIAGTTANRLHKWCRKMVSTCFFFMFSFSSKMQGWSESFIFFCDYETRKKATRANWPKKFSKITLILDGKAFSLKYFRREAARNLFTPEV